MPIKKRQFRTQESYEEEQRTRSRIARYLKGHGLREVQDDRKQFGLTQSQTVRAVLPTGDPVVMRVKLCWRPRKRKASPRSLSATQLIARVKGNRWEATLQATIDRQRAEGVTHLLVVQPEGRHITLAALVPLSELLGIWCAQRDTSSRLMKNGAISSRKNHAMNGSSPTLWLRDERAPEVAKQLWDSPGVIDLAAMSRADDAFGPDDTYDDLPVVDESIGSDRPERSTRERSYVRRDPRVRALVLRRAAGACERKGCGEGREYAGFLDVHHILGAAKSDRVENCVAICPNCHREAHFSPARTDINAALLLVAVGGRGSRTPERQTGGSRARSSAAGVR